MTAKLVPHRVKLEGVGFTGLGAQRGEAVCRLKSSKAQPSPAHPQRLYMGQKSTKFFI
jgi:hypothetical protein